MYYTVLTIHYLQYFASLLSMIPMGILGRKFFCHYHASRLCATTAVPLHSVRPNASINVKPKRGDPRHMSEIWPILPSPPSGI